MKKTILFALTILLFTFCKKSENDPNFTLLTRKARITGEWKITSLNKHTNESFYRLYNNDSVGRIITTMTSHDGSLITISSIETYKISIITNPLPIVANGNVLEHSYKFNKDGTWASTYQYNTLSSTSQDFFGMYTVTEKIDTKSKITQTGTWSFIGETNEYKNKERIILCIKNQTKDEITTTNTTSTPDEVTDKRIIHKTSVSTFADNENTFVWKITQLQNKKIEVETTEGIKETAVSYYENVIEEAINKKTNVTKTEATSKMTLTAK